MARFQDGSLSLILNGIRTPVDSDDAANKSYVDREIDRVVDSEIASIAVSVSDTEATITLTRNDTSELIERFSIRDTNNVFGLSREGNVPGPTANQRSSQTFLRADGVWAAAAGATGASITSASYDTDSEVWMFGLSNGSTLTSNRVDIQGPAGAPGCPGGSGCRWSSGCSPASVVSI